MRRFAHGDDVQPRGRFAMQPVGAPVRRDIRAVSPDRSELLSADGLPHLPAFFDVRTRVHRVAAIGDDILGNWWHDAMNLAAHPQQHTEGNGQQHRQTDPQPTTRAHDALSNIDARMLEEARLACFDVDAVGAWVY